MMDKDVSKAFKEISQSESDLKVTNLIIEKVTDVLRDLKEREEYDSARFQLAKINLLLLSTPENKELLREQRTWFSRVKDGCQKYDYELEEKSEISLETIREMLHEIVMYIISTEDE